VPDLHLKVADLKPDVGELRSGGVRPNSNPASSTG